MERQIRSQRLPPLPAMDEPAPALMQTSSEVGEAEEQTRRDPLRRRGLRSTVLAGETGGYQAPRRSIFA